MNSYSSAREYSKFKVRSNVCILTTFILHLETRTRNLQENRFLVTFVEKYTTFNMYTYCEPKTNPLFIVLIYYIRMLTLNLLLASSLAYSSRLTLAFTISPLSRSVFCSNRPCSYITETLSHEMYDDASKSQLGPQDRFKRVASSEMALGTPCILTLDGRQYNMTSWANAHPGGSSVLMSFNNKNATQAFYASGHSQQAIDMLQEFLIVNDNENAVLDTEKAGTSLPSNSIQSLTRIKSKFFTKEDPYGIHKYCGLFVLFHFTFRFLQSYFGDPSAGFGTRMGRGSSFKTFAFIAPHGILSLSSLGFHTVPKERIIGSPMIVSNCCNVYLSSLIMRASLITSMISNQSSFKLMTNILWTSSTVARIQST